MHWFIELLVDSLKEGMVFNVVTIPFALVLSLLAGFGVVDSFGFCLLIESTGLMFIGGAMAIGDSAFGREATKLIGNLFGRKGENAETEDKRERIKTPHLAAKYALTGVLLFLESMTMAAVFVFG